MTEIMTPGQIQERLWGKALQEQGINKRVSSALDGWIPQGKTVAELAEGTDFTRIAGEFAPRILVVSNPNNPLSLIPEQVAAAGGWCAIRTKDSAELGNGIIMNPATGQIEEVRSVEQVADWIPQSVAFDQIVESVGAVNVSEYAVISERRLWSQRITAKLSAILNRDLTGAEKERIEQSVEQAEIIRSVITRRYLEFVLGNRNVIFQRVVDDDIWDGLKKARDETLANAGLSVSSLQANFPKDASGIEYASLVWAMYSEPYFDLLRQQNYIQAKTAFIVEPVQHAAVETLPDREVAERIYGSSRFSPGAGVFLDPKGFNQNTGFIAYVECVNAAKQSTRKANFIGDVPNIANWQRLLRTGGLLDPEINAVIEPTGNNLFLWGVNLLPFQDTKQALLALSKLQERFKAEKDVTTARFTVSGKVDPQARQSLQREIVELKNEYCQLITLQNEKIAINLRLLFAYITQDLEQL